ncbi:MAG: PilZ domain-containing protein [Planctomycetota bacterium]
MHGQTHTGIWNDERATLKEWLADAQLEGQQDTYASKRQYPRVTWAVPVTLELLDGPRVGKCDFAVSKDISEGGIGVRCHRALVLRTLVRILIDECGPSVHARVTHCTETVGGFIIGVEF